MVQETQLPITEVQEEKQVEKEEEEERRRREGREKDMRKGEVEREKVEKDLVDGKSGPQKPLRSLSPLTGSLSSGRGKGDTQIPATTDISLLPRATHFVLKSLKGLRTALHWNFQSPGDFPFIAGRKCPSTA